MVFSGVNNSQPPWGCVLVAAGVVFFFGSYRVCHPNQPVDDSCKNGGWNDSCWTSGLPQVCTAAPQKVVNKLRTKYLRYIGVTFSKWAGKSSICTFYQGTVYDGNCSMFWECIHFILHFSPPKTQLNTIKLEVSCSYHGHCVTSILFRTFSSRLSVEPLCTRRVLFAGLKTPWRLLFRCCALSQRRLPSTCRWPLLMGAKTPPLSLRSKKRDGNWGERMMWRDATDQN